MNLFPYQTTGAEFLASKKRALLADDMGLGKSAQAIAACDAVGAKTVQVVCPASVVENWSREIQKFRAGAWTYNVMSYDRAARGYAADEPVDVIILDEAHFLKNPKAKRTKAIFGAKCDGVGGLVERAKHVFLLSGTPMPNNPSELWPMLRAVMPQAIKGQYGGMREGAYPKPLSYWTFVNKYCRTRDNGFGLQIVGAKNMEHLKACIAPYVLRRKKDEVLKDLPPIRFDELPLWCSITDSLKEVGPMISLIEKTLAEKGVAGLKEIAPHVASLRRVTGLAKVAPAVEWIKDWREAGGGKLVVFAHHRDVIEALSDSLDRAVVVTGSTEPRVRQAAVDTFQNDEEITAFIGQIQAAGTGITLTAASDMLFVESSWVPAENEQAAMRIHRIGQRNACLVRFATLAGSIDEQIQRAVMRKTADISKLFA